MNVSTILISQDEARQKLDQYKSIVASKRTKEDDKLQSLYGAVSKGARVVNVANAFKQTGLNEKHQPKLAMARADWKIVNCFRSPWIHNYTSTSHTAGFTDQARWNGKRTAQNILLPNNTFAFPANTQLWHALKSPVPHLPPNLRPKYALHNYHILFEVENWEEYPVDPFLLRHIGGQLYVVEAEWELTELEASLLSGLMTGN